MWVRNDPAHWSGKEEDRRVPHKVPPQNTKNPPTHTDRTHTNDRVIELASVAQGKPIELFTKIWTKLKLKLLGHILRCDESDPIRQVVLEQRGWEPD